MAYAPLNIGFSQGRAIRLGSSRSLKVYRGVRELGSSDPVLIIHDGFGGSGGLSGRTPDTVSNGNTWTTYNSETYTLGSGAVNASNDYTDFSKSADIDVGT